MKQPNPVLAKQQEYAREYNALIAKSGLSYKELTDALGVRYECILGRRKLKQTITTEALLALRYVVIEREADRLVTKARAGVDREEVENDPLAGVM